MWICVRAFSPESVYNGAVGRHFVFPAPFQTGQFTTYVPAAVLAEISSPLDGVDFGLLRSAVSRGYIEALRP